MNEEHKLSNEVRDEIKNDALQGSGFNGQFFRAKKPFRTHLSKPMPPQAILPHPQKSYLSTIKAIFIIERLNEVFGILGWDFEHEVVGLYDNTDKNGEVIKQVVVRGRIYVREFDLYTPVQYGGKNLDGKGQEPVDGFKSAVTDALTKCASFLEIGIQVFKGTPQDQNANISRRKEQHEELPTAPPPKKEIEEMPDKVDGDAVEMEELREKHKEVFGKYPNKNWSAETVADRIETELKTADAEPTPTPEEPVKAETESPTDDAPAMKPNTDFDDAPKPFEPLIEDKDALGTAKKTIDSFLDSASLKENASTIILDAQMDGATDDEIKEIKNYANEVYQKLLNDEG